MIFQITIHVLVHVIVLSKKSSPTCSCNIFHIYIFQDIEQLKNGMYVL
jgi:hypothetical protein